MSRILAVLAVVVCGSVAFAQAPQKNGFPTKMERQIILDYSKRGISLSVAEARYWACVRLKIKPSPEIIAAARKAQEEEQARVAPQSYAGTAQQGVNPVAADHWRQRMSQWQAMRDWQTDRAYWDASAAVVAAEMQNAARRQADYTAMHPRCPYCGSDATSPANSVSYPNPTYGTMYRCPSGHVFAASR